MNKDLWGAEAAYAAMCGVMIASAGWVTPTVRVVGHEGSTVIMVFDGLRLVRSGEARA